jgi:hypothetical protein
MPPLDYRSHGGRRRYHVPPYRLRGFDGVRIKTGAAISEMRSRADRWVLRGTMDDPFDLDRDDGEMDYEIEVIDLTGKDSGGGKVTTGLGIMGSPVEIGKQKDLFYDARESFSREDGSLQRGSSVQMRTPEASSLRLVDMTDSRTHRQEILASGERYNSRGPYTVKARNQLATPTSTQHDHIRKLDRGATIDLTNDSKDELLLLTPASNPTTKLPTRCHMPPTPISTPTPSKPSSANTGHTYNDAIDLSSGLAKPATPQPRPSLLAPPQTFNRPSFENAKRKRLREMKAKKQTRGKKNGRRNAMSRPMRDLLC